MFRIHRDNALGESVLSRFRDDAWQDLYAFDEARVSLGDVEAANHVAATWDQGPFGTHLTFGAYRGDARYGLFDRQLTVEGPEGVDRRELASAEELAEVLGLPLNEDELPGVWQRINR